ncbi:MAG TPA: hypothetical protein VES03_06885 [Motilibacterales bacterium]|nr:hypothetical protein [Motilibacterales bacterium]
MTDREPRSNRARSVAFRNEVILHLHNLGLTSATRRAEPKA